MCIQTRFDACETWKTQRFEREIDQVHAEIQNTAAARERKVVEPRFVWPISVMKHGIDGKDFAERAGLDQPTHHLHRRNVSVREIHAEQTTRSLCGFNDASCFGSRSTQRFLTEHSKA